MNPQKLAKWKRWLGDVGDQGTILREMADLATIRMVYSGVREMVEKNKALQQHSAFHSVFSLNYAHTALMYIRRQVRPHRDSIGLIMLAEDLYENCHMVTRDFYVSLYTQEAQTERGLEWKRQAGNSDFERFAGSVGNHLDPAVIQDDIEEMNTIADESSSFIDRRLAHLDHREPTQVPTYAEIDGWCDTLNLKLKKYVLLLEAADYQIEPVLHHDWKAIFRVPWISE